jgi:hypothetical protein
VKQDRRQFLTSTLAVVPMFVPRSAWGANDRLAYGLLGSGGRGRSLRADQFQGDQGTMIISPDGTKTS